MKQWIALGKTNSGSQDGMRKLFCIVALLCSPACAGTWAMVQHQTNTTCSGGTSCSVTVTSTGTGDLGICIAHIPLTNTTISSCSGGGTWTLCASSGCKQNDATAGTVDLAYTLSTTSGATSVTVNTAATVSGTWDIAFIAYSTTSGPAVFDNLGIRDQSSAATNIAGATVGTLTGTNDVIVQTGTFAGTASGCGSQGGTNNNPNDFPNGDAVCGFINTTTTTANTYTNTSSRAALSVIAFKETVAGGTKTCTLALMGVGC